MRWRMSLAILLFGVLALGAIGWWQRAAVMAWYEVRNLATAGEADREKWVGRIAAHGDASVPALIRCLRRQEEQACGNARAALAQVAGPTEKRQSALANRLADSFPSLSMAGQIAALNLVSEWLWKSPIEARPMVAAAVRLLPPGGRAPDKAVRSRTLGLAALILNHQCTGDERNACRELVRNTLQDNEPANRVDAIRMASTPSLSMLRQVAPLLTDSVAEVRQTAMAVVGCAPEAIPTDDLLHSLHDSDADVRRLCEAALRGRGLCNEDVTLGRLITDSHGLVRMQVLERLRRADLEPGIWLRRLSRDPAPAVRAAAVRVAVESRLDLHEQLEMMAQNDPSQTVRQLAKFYLARQKSSQAGGASK